MKKMIKILIATAFLSIGSSVWAQSPPPPPGDPSKGGGGGGPVGGAPIDGGLGILLVMGAAFGGVKLYQTRKKKKIDPVTTDQ